MKISNFIKHYKDKNENVRKFLELFTIKINVPNHSKIVSLKLSINVNTSKIIQVSKFNIARENINIDIVQISVSLKIADFRHCSVVFLIS